MSVLERSHAGFFANVGTNSLGPVMQSQTKSRSLVEATVVNRGFLLYVLSVSI